VPAAGVAPCPRSSRLERGDEAPGGGARVGMVSWAAARRDVHEDERATAAGGVGEEEGGI
jgi:hypothetical protein